jgi:RimJ/RimL family protein N-acetyltransferase
MDIQLEQFNKQYLDSLEGRENIRYDEEGVYYTVSCDGESAGVVGYIPSLAEKNAGFIQIVLDPKFRGKGITLIAEDMLAKKHGLKKLYAKIELSNEASIKAHLKAGFKYPKDARLEKEY